MNHKTNIFLDGGNPAETKELIKLLGSVDGQTTNPTLIAKSPGAQERLAQGVKFSKKEIMDYYYSVVEELSSLIPHGSVSIEVYADENTTAREMLAQAKVMNSWIGNAHIKYPTTKAGLEAAEESVKEGVRVNMTLCFSEAQAAAVYAATRGAKKGQVFVSPFIGRLDDIGLNGIDLIANIVRLYKQGDGHVEVLAASIRNVDHLLASFAVGADIVTAPLSAYAAWVEAGKTIPGPEYMYDAKSLKTISFEEYDLDKPWQSFNIEHELTTKGIARFAADWNALIG